MKKVFLATLLLITLGAFAQERTIKPMDLPRNAQILIKETFNFQKVTLAEMDADSRETEYTAYLADNTKIEFDAEGNWKEVENRQGLIPASLIPSEVSAWCSKHHPNIKIVQIKKEHGSIEVELENDVDVVFNPKTGRVSVQK